MSEHDTVTITLENYEAMKSKIKTLEEQVKEKTIVKYKWHSTAITLTVLVALMVLFWKELILLAQ